MRDRRILLSVRAIAFRDTSGRENDAVTGYSENSSDFDERGEDCMSRSLLIEAAEILRESNDIAEAKEKERELHHVMAIGKEQYDKHRCKRYEDRIKGLEAELRLLRKQPAPQIGEEQGKQMKTAMHRDLDKWAAQGGTID